MKAVNHVPIITKMTEQVSAWKQVDDRRSVFLDCYRMMTANVLKALQNKRFDDNDWVEELLHLFADYYFNALVCFNCGEKTSKVWEDVHTMAATKNLHVVQHLLLGVNAHINYDLVFTIDDLLGPEWNTLSDKQQIHRFHDHLLINAVIAETIDKVQDELIEEHHPMMDFVDRLLGRFDERIFVFLIRRWRHAVWDNAVSLMESKTDNERRFHTQRIEMNVLRTQRLLLGQL